MEMKSKKLGTPHTTHMLPNLFCAQRIITYCKPVSMPLKQKNKSLHCMWRITQREEEFPLLANFKNNNNKFSERISKGNRLLSPIEKKCSSSETILRSCFLCTKPRKTQRKWLPESLVSAEMFLQWQAGYKSLSFFFVGEEVANAHPNRPFSSRMLRR